MRISRVLPYIIAQKMYSNICRRIFFMISIGSVKTKMRFKVKTGCRTQAVRFGRCCPYPVFFCADLYMQYCALPFCNIRRLSTYFLRKLRHWCRQFYRTPQYRPLRYRPNGLPRERRRLLLLRQISPIWHFPMC